jgi:hypothetical protein
LQCITAGQHQLWCAIQSEIAQVLRHKRRSAIAAARGRPPPPPSAHTLWPFETTRRDTHPPNSSLTSPNAGEKRKAKTRGVLRNSVKSSTNSASGKTSKTRIAPPYTWPS